MKSCSGLSKIRCYKEVDIRWVRFLFEKKEKKKSFFYFIVIQKTKKKEKKKAKILNSFFIYKKKRKIIIIKKKDILKIRYYNKCYNKVLIVNSNLYFFDI